MSSLRDRDAYHLATETAIMSQCQTRRYVLARGEPHAPFVLFCGLNPSTAAWQVEDATSRRFLSFATSWGYKRYVTVNAASLRATDPIELKGFRDPIGHENDYWIQLAAERADKVVVCWGAGIELLPGRVDALLAHALRDRELWCLGRTKAGHPKHPLYLKSGTSLERWGPA